MKDISLKLTVWGLLCSAFLFTAGCSSESQAEAQPTTTASETSKQTIDAFATIKANSTTSLSINFPTIIEKVNVKEGQIVNKGDVLLNLNMVDFEEQLHSKQAELDLEKKLLNVQQTNISKGIDAELNKLVNEAADAEALYDKCLNDLADKEVLFKNGFLSQFEYNELKRQVESNKKALDNAKLSIQSYNQNKSNDFDRSKLTISKLNSDIAIMKEKLNKSYLKNNSIVCDIEKGLVLNLKPTPGYIAVKETDADTLLNLVDMNSLIALADVDEGFIKDVKPGAKVTIIPLSDRSKSYIGKVSRLTDKAIVKNGQTFIQTEIAIENIDDFLKLDYNVDVQISME